MGVSSPEAREGNLLPSAHGATLTTCFLVDDSFRSKIIVGAFSASVGVMTALLLATFILPEPTTLVGAHPTILPSHAAQLRIEPREKAFVGLALALGFVAAVLASFLVRRRIGLSKRTLVSLLSLIPLFNFCCDRGLNQTSGANWAFAGLLTSVAIAWFVLTPPSE